MPDEEHIITEAELDAFLQKLNGWAKSLDPGEQALLNVVIARASDEAAEVQGFSMDFGMSAGTFLRPVVASGGMSIRSPGTASGVKGWVKEGEMWMKSGAAVDRVNPQQ